MGYSPCESYLRAALAVLLADVRQDSVVDQFGDTLAFLVDGVGIAEWLVLRDMNAFRLVPGSEVLLR